MCRKIKIIRIKWIVGENTFVDNVGSVTVILTGMWVQTAILATH
jgi:hypothetical protein